MELEAERTPCSWETEEEMAGSNLLEPERAKMGPVLLDDDRDDDDTH
jgi:hypothetical protein